VTEESKKEADRAIEEFHRAARKRKAVIFAVAAVICLATGIGAVAIALTSDGDPAGGRFRLKALVVAGGLIVAGVFSAVAAYRIGSGQIDDIDS
jgi:hypothetical protein